MNIDKVSEFIGSDAYTPMTIKKIAEALRSWSAARSSAR